MDRAWENGIHWFDTADAYGGGRSESCIGGGAEARKPDGLVLTTKVFHSTAGDPADTGLAPDRIRRQIEASLERLGVERVDLYLAHEPDPRDAARRDDRLLRAAPRGRPDRARGGSSNYDHAGVAEALRHGQPALVQNPYSLLDRADEDGVLPLCEANAISLRPVRPALRRLADRQVPARRAVPGRLADDDAARAVRAVRRRPRLRRARPAARGSRGARRRRWRRSRSRGCSPPSTALCAARTAPSSSIRSSKRATSRSLPPTATA